jgi:hypothetical protein
MDDAKLFMTIEKSKENKVSSNEEKLFTITTTSSCNAFTSIKT